ncbi:hypothetical protein COP2_038945 [Malus domestica]
MASKKAQVVLTANARNKSIITAGGVTSGVITRSKARALFAACSTPASTLPKEESPWKYSGSMFSDADTSGNSAMQVMTTGLTLIDEQMAHMNEVIVRLTRIVEEKDQKSPHSSTTKMRSPT